MNTLLFGTDEQRNLARTALLRMDDVNIVAESSQESALLNDIDHSKADIAMICIDETPRTYRIAQQVYQLRPKCLVMGIAVKGVSMIDMGAILRCGICHVVDPFADAGASTAAFQEVCGVEQSRQSALTDSSFQIADSKIFSVYGTKDGLGGTSLAVNLGMMLSKMGKKTIILDFDLQFGDCALQLGLSPKRTLTDLIHEGENPTIDSIRQNIALHPSGLNVLPAPSNPEFVDQITATQLDAVIGAVSGFYDYILINTPTTFNEITAMCAEKSSIFFFLTRADISTLRNTKKVLLLIDMLGQAEKVRCILGQVRKGARIAPKDASNALGIQFWRQFPYDVSGSCDAVNQGTPISMFQPRCELTQAFSSIAASIVAENENLDADSTASSVLGSASAKEKRGRGFKAPKAPKVKAPKAPKVKAPKAPRGSRR